MVSRRTGLVAAVLALAVLAGGAAALLRGSDEDVPALNRLLVASADLDGRAHLFGDPVRARLEVVYHATRIRPDSIAVEASFAPYRIVERRESRDSFGSIERVRVDFSLECLTARCVPRSDGLFEFPRARVRYRQREFPVDEGVAVDWPRLRVGSRVGLREVEVRALRADVRDLPAVSYRIGPGALATAGYSLAALLALAGALLLAHALGARARLERRLTGRPSRLSALQRALALVRRQTRRGEADASRRALDRLAVELRETSEPDLARDASRLAWRRNDPSETSVDPLSHEVERVIAGREE